MVNHKIALLKTKLSFLSASIEKVDVINHDYDDFIGDVKLKMDEFGNLDWQEALLGRKVKGVFVCETWIGTGNESMDSPSLRVFSFNIIKELYYK